MTLKIGDTVQDIATKCKGKLISIDKYHMIWNDIITNGRTYLVSYLPTTEQEWEDQGERLEYHSPTELIKI
tara:strand:+ start:155 stop:367 length:213 start_codon:yes stop_codon:yes gene_type:complete